VFSDRISIFSEIVRFRSLNTAGHSLSALEQSLFNSQSLLTGSTTSLCFVNPSVSPPSRIIASIDGTDRLDLLTASEIVPLLRSPPTLGEILFSCSRLARKVQDRRFIARLVTTIAGRKTGEQIVKQYGQCRGLREMQRQFRSPGQ
jgi:hypothetical protein